MLLPLSGLLAGVKPRVKLLALAIPYSGNPKVRYDTVFSLGPFNINKSPFRCPCVVTPFGVAGRGKASREIACIGHSTHSGNPKVRYDTVFSLGPFNIDKSPFRGPYAIYPFRGCWPG